MIFEPDRRWPEGVRAAMTNRQGGVSAAPFTTLNLATHVGDDAQAVSANRARLNAAVGVRRIQWLNQVHGAAVAAVGADNSVVPDADAAVSSVAGVAVAVLVADCLPVLMARADGGLVAVAHAGWRGLFAGVLAHTVSALGGSTGIACWLGPAICQTCYEVGEELLEQAPHALRKYFDAGRRARHFQFDLRGAARACLLQLGVRDIADCGICVRCGGDGQFFSYRRDGDTGRCAALIWRSGEEG